MTNNQTTRRVGDLIPNQRRNDTRPARSYVFPYIVRVLCALRGIHYIRVGAGILVVSLASDDEWLAGCADPGILAFG